MNISKHISLLYDAKFGYFVSISNDSLADEFDDFLVEDADIDSAITVDSGMTNFFLPKLMSESESKNLIERFLLKYPDNL